MPQSSPHYLFTGGNARSGTSALTMLLNEHPEVIIGIERYSGLWNGHGLTPAHFEKDTFLSFDGISVDHPKFKLMAKFNFKDRFGDNRFIGDKYPFILTFHDFIFETFENATILAIFRNPLSVCESHQRRFDNPKDAFNLNAEAALKRWNEAVRLFFKAVEKGHDVRCVSYERLFSSGNSMKRLMDHLDLDPDLVDEAALESYVSEYHKLSASNTQRNEDIRWDVAQNANFDGYRKLMDEFCILRPESDAATFQTHETPGRRILS